MRITPTMVLFWRSSCVYSNWHPSLFCDEGKEFLNTEQYLMWHKAMLFGDQVVAEAILRATSPAAMKALGRKVKGFDEAIWSRNRFGIMARGCYLKFRQNPDMEQELDETGERILVEASPVDRIWGIGLAEDDPRSLNQETWQGLNLLGKALMVARANLRTDTIPALPY